MGKSVKEGVMPKEFIHCRDFGRQVPVQTGDSTFELMPLDSDAVKVGWSKESGHVELAVVQMVDGSFVEHGFIESAVGSAEGVLVDHAEELRQAQLTPRYIQLDRAGLNRLIRTLRQARDDAYGADA